MKSALVCNCTALLLLFSFGERLFC